jgi:hypothetical protein
MLYTFTIQCTCVFFFVTFGEEKIGEISNLHNFCLSCEEM